MITENPSNTSRMTACPSFDGCSAPLCPLDELQSVRIKLPGDYGCKATKRVRFRLGEGLPLHGLTKQEYSNAIRFNGTLEAFYSKITIGKKNQNCEDIVNHS